MATEEEVTNESKYQIGDSVSKTNIKDYLSKSFTIARGSNAAQRIWVAWTEFQNANFSGYIEQTVQREVTLAADESGDDDSEEDFPPFIFNSILTDEEASFLLNQALLATRAHQPKEYIGTDRETINIRTGESKTPLNEIYIHYEVNNLVGFFRKNSEVWQSLSLKLEVLQFLEFAGLIEEGIFERFSSTDSNSIDHVMDLLKTMDSDLFHTNLSNFVIWAREKAIQNKEA